MIIAELLGIKTTINGFVAYQKFSVLVKESKITGVNFYNKFKFLNINF